MPTRLSPVKQKIVEELDLHEQERSIVVGLYHNFKPKNKKSSKKNVVIKFVKFCFGEFGKSATLAGINRWLELIESGELDPRVEKSKLGPAYIKGIIKNYVGKVSDIQINDVCYFCRSELVNGKCINCD